MRMDSESFKISAFFFFEKMDDALMMCSLFSHEGKDENVGHAHTPRPWPAAERATDT